MLVGAAALVVTGTAAAHPQKPAYNRHRLGIAVTPKHFPSSSPQDVEEALTLAKAVGEHAVLIVQWRDANVHDIASVMRTYQRAGLHTILGLSPTTLDQQRGAIDAPPAVRQTARSPLSFGDPVVRGAFTETARKMAELKPPYLCLATEINLLAFANLQEYLLFASLYQETYREVKRISPKTKVFVSFQWDWFRVLDDREPEANKLAEHTKLIDVFRPLDVVAFTTYPSPLYQSPADLPPDYYTSMSRHLRPGDEILLMEVGWPTTGTGTEAEQAAYIQRLPDLLRGLDISIMAWALLHDVKVPAFDANLNTVGLLDYDGNRKPGYDTFLDLGGNSGESLRMGCRKRERSGILSLDAQSMSEMEGGGSVTGSGSADRLHQHCPKPQTARGGGQVG